MAWTDEMVEDLRKMWHEGLTTGEIGKRLGVSKNSIVGKVHRLGLSGRPSPIKKKNEPAKEKNETPKEAAKKEEKNAKKAKPEKNIKEDNTSKPEIETKVSEVEVKETRIEIIRNSTKVEHPKQHNKVMLTDLDNHTCRWPIGDPKDENFHFCGKKIKIGQTYCEEHANIAYVKASKK